MLLSNHEIKNGSQEVRDFKTELPSALQTQVEELFTLVHACDCLPSKRIQCAVQSTVNARNAQHFVCLLRMLCLLQVVSYSFFYCLDGGAASLHSLSDLLSHCRSLLRLQVCLNALIDAECIVYATEAAVCASIGQVPFNHQRCLKQLTAP